MAICTCHMLFLLKHKDQDIAIYSLFISSILIWNYDFFPFLIHKWRRINLAVKTDAFEKKITIKWNQNAHANHGILPWFEMFIRLLIKLLFKMIKNVSNDWTRNTEKWTKLIHMWKSKHNEIWAQKTMNNECDRTCSDWSLSTKL